MLNLLKSDFYKLFKQKSLYICLIIVVALAAINVFALDYMQHISTQMSQTNETDLKIFELSQSASSYIKSSFSLNAMIIVGVVVPLFVTSEFRLGTIKNTLSRGMSRNSVFISKLLISCLISIVFMLIQCLSSTVSATILWGFGNVDGGFWADLIKFILLQLYICVAYASLFTMVSFIISSTGGAIALNICLIQFSSVIVSLIQMVVYKITGVNYEITNGLLSTVLNELVNESLTKDLISKSLIVPTVYCVITIALGLLAFSRKDIK